MRQPGKLFSLWYHTRSPCLSFAKFPVNPSSHKWAPRIPSSMRTLDSQTQDKFRKVNVVVLSDTNFWKNLDMCSRIFELAFQALRVSDGMKGGTPGILYDL